MVFKNYVSSPGHPKYKTEICKTFHTIGTCPYGTRCRFIHKMLDEEEEGMENNKHFPENDENHSPSLGMSSPTQDLPDVSRSKEPGGFSLDISSEHLNFNNMKMPITLASNQNADQLFSMMDRETLSGETLMKNEQTLLPISYGRKRALSTPALSICESNSDFTGAIESSISLMSSPTLESQNLPKLIAHMQTRRLPVFQHLEEA